MANISAQSHALFNMIIIGHINIKFDIFAKIDAISQIKQTPPNCVLLLNQNDKNIFEIIEHCETNKILFGVNISNINNLMIFSSLNCAFFVIKNKKLLKQAQKIADNYLFDAKILGYLKNQNNIQYLAKIGIDGAIFKTGIMDCR